MGMSFEEWLKIISTDELDKLKNDKSFKFCKQNLYKHFNVGQKMLAKIIKHYNYDIKPLTRSRKLTQEEWIQKAKEKHNNEYDYSKVVYINGSSKVEVICKKHGSFWQNSSTHINRGDNCPKCSLDKKADNNRTPFSEFIRKASEIHNNKFDYSLVHNYGRLDEKFKIICPKHGTFEVSGRSHLQGYDCEKCSYEKRGVDYSISKEEMLKRFKAFNNGLIYDMSGYKNTNSIIYYECPIHGRQKQTAAKHLKSKNCWKCNKSKAWNTSNTKDFVEKALMVHNGYYSYDKVDYIKNSKNVIITCSHHGDFKQRPNTHLLGAGCHVCANITSNFKDAEKHEVEEAKEINCTLYIMYFPREDFYKIGLSRYLKNRLKGIKYDSGLYYTPKIEYEFHTTLFEAAHIEDTLHLKYKEYSYRPLTYFKGHTECFTADLPIEEIKKYLLKLP